MIIAIPTGLKYLVACYFMDGLLRLTTPSPLPWVYHSIYDGGLTGIF
jgi:hypothetical protein